MSGQHKFIGEIKIIGINPYVQIPESVLNSIFEDANKSKGPIPISGTVNGHHFKQTLVKYAGEWRFYINTIILENSPKRIGEKIEITIGYDPEERIVPMHPLLKAELNKNKEAKLIFEKLPPSKQKEIKRYIASLKTEEKIMSNVSKAINFLLGKGSFAGRNKL